ncbi:(2Fe-2S) ferredoxin domain-containing protein [Caldithrix abyssi]
MQFPEKHIFVCEHQRDANAPQASCANSGGGEIRARLKERLLEKGLHKAYRVNTAGCLGKCGCGPTLVIYPAGIWYGRITLDDVDEIIEKSILANEVIERLDLKK